MERRKEGRRGERWKLGGREAKGRGRHEGRREERKGRRRWERDRMKKWEGREVKGKGMEGVTSKKKKKNLEGRERVWERDEKRRRKRKRVGKGWEEKQVKKWKGEKQGK